MLNEEKQIKYSKNFIIVCFIAAFIIMAFNLLGGRSNKSGIGIYNNGNGTGDVGTKLQQAIGNQQEISAGITDSKGTADAIGSSIERSQTANKSAAEAVDRAGSLVEEAGRITAENLEILATVRARGSAGDRSQD
ncbi:hypothetical protein [Segatella sp.]|uniref:hypothetical protein n=1 Tax=Segatella sp. TaxID=2974253 RepID=UPI003AB7D3C3